MLVLTIKDLETTKDYFKDSTKDYIKVKESDMRFIDFDTFIVNIDSLDLEENKEILFFNGIEGYYVKVATTEYSYIYCLDGSFY